ncbi:TPA: hypothetical protein RJ964_003626 [Enterobacter hormaechei]|nr:hypothetical protein [Enterobacter hormaechei]EKW7976188.1 hypothetical protein [Enterobacter hormaechei]ELD3491431.1 hypothetical protein [Enterobacter hormaechei]MDX7383241.1 hypothetical protein [Enterobacter hormaechei]WKA97967.1 hypothetical protein QT958_13585 [Enterobacter hormaechei]WKG19081.1 hypothetical protein QY056_11315 [Enterobacter hormaechei subsp. xiangfangensis]
MSELVKLGHDQVAELKSSCGAVDVRDVAQLISDLATQLDVQLARSNALAAENAGLKEFVKTCFRAAADGASMDGADIQELGERLGLFGRETYQPALHGYICGHEAGEDTVYVMNKTPATDAYLAEVRASGVEMAVDVVKQCYDNICAGGLQENREYEESIVQPHLDGIDDELKEIIAQLRKGVQS